MKIWTFGEAKEVVQRELDMQSETFIDDDEWLDYFNDAIDEAEQEIMNLHQEYLKKSDTVSLVNGTASYAMPEDIYAHKILYLHYEYNNESYQIQRVKHSEIAGQNTITSSRNQNLKYDIVNEDPTTGAVIKFYPTPDATEPGAVVRHYIRNANRLEDDNSVIDLPEAMGFIFAFVKVRAAAKETHPGLPHFITDLDRKRDKMKETLDNMTEDQPEIDVDFGFYEDHR